MPIGWADGGVGPERGWEVDHGVPWITADRLHLSSPLRHLYEYLLASGLHVAMPAGQAFAREACGVLTGNLVRVSDEFRE